MYTYRCSRTFWYVRPAYSRYGETYETSADSARTDVLTRQIILITNARKRSEVKNKVSVFVCLFVLL